MVCRSVATQLARQRGEGREVKGVGVRVACLWRGGANPTRSPFVPGEATLCHQGLA